MKASYLSLFSLILVCAPTVFAQTSAWQWQNPLPQGNTLIAVHFADATHGWAVGKAGTIVHTADSGTSWQAQPSGTSLDLTDVYFVDAQTGWSAGGKVTMLHTTDGGATWVAQNVGLQFGLLTDVHFMDANRGWASTNTIVAGSDKIVVITADGGATWGQVDTGSANDLLGIYFADAAKGWAVGVDGEILRTDDGGAIWEAQTSGTHDTFWDVAFADSSVGLAAGPVGFVYLTDDGGRTWSELLLPATISGNKQVNSKHCTLALIALIELGSQSPTLLACLFEIFWGKLDRVNKAGKRLPEVAWTRLAPGTNEEIWAAAIVDPTTAWIAGTNGVIMQTRDAGLTWNLQASSVTVRLEGAFFLNTNQGWIVGAGGTILHTADGGISWNPQTSGTTQDLRTVYFLDEQRGWAAGRSRTFLRTTDGGATWTPQPLTGSFAGFYDIAFADEMNGWLVGDLGAIFHTIDSGATWAQVPSGTTNALLGIDFVDAENGWISGESGTILRFTGEGGTGTAIEDERGAVPDVFLLNQNYPNPFNPQTTIAFSVLEAGHVRLQVFDALGRVVETLLDDPRVAGSYSVNWKAHAVPSGLYFYRLQIGQHVETRAMTLIR